MDFQFSSEQHALIESVRRLTHSRLGRPTSRRDVHGGVPREHLKVLANAGFAGISLPGEQGGQGGSLLDAVLVVETAAAVNPNAGDACQALNFGAIQQLSHAGSSFVRDTYLRPCLEGRALTAVAMTEPGAGSAVGEMRTTAEVTSRSVTVNGEKIFTTHGGDADFFVVWAKFSGQIGAVVVESNTRGLSVNSQNTFLSGEHYGVLHFDDCVVPRAQVLVETGGLRSLLPIFNVERLGNAARSLALGQAAFSIALKHAFEREQFSQKILDFQGIQWRLAELKLQLESARLLLYKAASNASAGLPSECDTALAKLACNRVGFAVADAALQICGGSGYDSGGFIGYLFERTRGWLIAGGTAEQMLNRVARSLIKESDMQDGAGGRVS